MNRDELDVSKYQQILNEIQADQRYLRNLDWGKPRKGHPEGSVRLHLDHLEENLERLRSRLSADEYWKLRILIHTHDTFKAEAKQGVPIADPRSHASLARAFLADYTEEAQLLEIVQLHDEPYAIWRKHCSSGDCTDRLEQLCNRIEDWDLFLVFLIIDGCTPGKTREPLTWFRDQIEQRIDSRVTHEWLM